MEDYFKRLFNATDITMIIDNINEMFNKVKKDMFSACHGRYHAMFVIDTVEYILKSLSYDSKTVEFGKIAALLHDIGNIAGRWNHARKSAVLTVVFLDGLENLTSEEKDIIIQAIEDHSDANNISSAIGAALFIADKTDISKRRILPVETIDVWSSNLLEIEDVNICVSDKTILINHITTEAFSKDILINGYAQQFNTLIKAAEYLGCTCQIQFNGTKENFAV